MRDSFRALRLVVATTLRADPRRAVAVLLLEPASAAVQPLFALWLKLLADGALGHDAGLVATGAGALACSMALLWLVGGAGTRMRVTLTERVGFTFDRRIAEISATLPTLEHHERADYQDRLAMLREQQGVLGNTVNTVVQTVRVVVPAAVTLTLLVTLHPSLVLLPAFAVPSLLVALRSQRWQRDAEERAAPGRRLSGHLYELTLHAGPAKELRVFRLRDEVARRHRAAWLEGHRIRAAAQWRTALWSSLASVVFAAGFAAAVALVVQRAVRGNATPGDVLLAIGLARQVNTAAAQTVFSVSSLQQSLRAAGRLLWLVDHARAQARPAAVAVPPAVLRGGIELDGVSFRYPGTAAWVLRDVSFRLEPGSVVALVGENGAGKTSLVKLLLGLYEPTEGRILVDGTDLRDIDPGAWRARTAAAFQDFTRLELRADEVVGVGDLEHLTDAGAVVDALARAGASDVVAGLPRGLHTQLGRSWPGGTDLSTGQWQKLAVARALMRQSPLVLALDEPTASLDATTEHRLFERYVHAARGGAGVTLLVSHRFSTVRAADEILVLDGGRVVQRGPHRDLVTSNGVYAELYELQAASYR
ncbi:MAG TPA: ABC transporter ATP-binding protein [Frankiaceae bacterium]|nr:ABC transporter ATP-binding protein [Frankiaceae bacterium]